MLDLLWQHRGGDSQQARFLLNTHWQEKYRLAGSHVLRRNGLIWEEGCLGQQVGCQSFAQGQLNLGPGHSSTRGNQL